MQSQLVIILERAESADPFNIFEPKPGLAWVLRDFGGTKATPDASQNLTVFHCFSHTDGTQSQLLTFLYELVENAVLPVHFSRLSNCAPEQVLLPFPVTECLACHRLDRS